MIFLGIYLLFMSILSYVNLELSPGQAIWNNPFSSVALVSTIIHECSHIFACFLSFTEFGKHYKGSDFKIGVTGVVRFLIFFGVTTKIYRSVERKTIRVMKMVAV